MPLDQQLFMIASVSLENALSKMALTDEKKTQNNFELPLEYNLAPKM